MFFKNAPLKELLRIFAVQATNAGIEGLSPALKLSAEDKMDAIAAELTRRFFQPAQAAKPDEWFCCGSTIFNAALVELVTGNTETCVIHYQGFSQEFDGEEAAAVWQWFSQKAKAPADWPEEELHG